MYRSWPNLIWLLLPLMAQASEPEAGELENGLAAYHAKNYAQAFMHLQPLAEEGVPAAQFTLGEMYRRGRGFVKSTPEALPLLKQAAEANHLPALNVLGEMHEAGEGVAQDFEAAAQWFQKAADAGDAKGRLNLALHYLRVEEVRDFNQAAKWFKLAAEQNELEAQYFYARLLLDGKGVEQNAEEAMTWLARSSAQGHAPARRFLHLLQQDETPDRNLALRELKRYLSAGVATLEAVSTDAGYGFEKTNPIKPGPGFESEWRYLNALRGPSGEIVHYQRLGHCCAFNTDASERGKGFLDQYELTYDGLAKPLILYLNMFEEAQMKAPQGFTFTREKEE
ncbi:MAG: sel1 repeat family protein [Hydrogenophilales bacterium]|nr:sel1 repeat family protein [Hydrogenophilales bacterium]